MNKIGDIKRGHELGRINNEQYVWQVCERCNEERWVYLREYQQGKNRHCVRCSNTIKAGKGAENHEWEGGRRSQYGYVLVYIYDDDFYRPMANEKNYVAEHRLVMAKSLGRNLQKWEFVHHKNGIRNDNRLENLELTTKSNHAKDHNKGYQDGYRKGLMDGRTAKITQLESRIKELGG
jgi:hypothetical protein